MARKLDIIVQIEVDDTEKLCSRGCRYFRHSYEACSLHNDAVYKVLKRKGRGFLRSDVCRAAELDLLGMKAM